MYRAKSSFGERPPSKFTSRLRVSNRVYTNPNGLAGVTLRGQAVTTIGYAFLSGVEHRPDCTPRTPRTPSQWHDGPLQRVRPGFDSRQSHCLRAIFCARITLTRHPSTLLLNPKQNVLSPRQKICSRFCDHPTTTQTSTHIPPPLRGSDS